MILKAAAVLAGSLILDALIGDPAVPGHPVRVMGSLASRAETAFRRLFGAPFPGDGQRGYGARSRLAGVVTWISVVGASGAAAWGLEAAARAAHPILGLAADIIIVWASIAPSDLAAHAGRVRRALERDARDGDAPIRGRRAVSRIVGRDVSVLDGPGVVRACIESVAESSIDGVAAPLFWAAAGGPAAAFVYRAINTMDSMFGHRSERYIDFGLVPARADDAANWIPARLSSLLACLLAPLAGGSIRTALRVFVKFRRAHESPNAGHPEAAYAGVLDLRLGGPSLYEEGLIAKPWINPEGGTAQTKDIRRAVLLMYAQTVLSAALFAGLHGILAGLLS